VSAEAIRQVAVTRLTAQEEIANVVRGAASVVVLVWIYLAATLGDGSDARRSLLPYQSLIQTQNTRDQRMFRELQEGLLEAELMRSSEGAWPLPTALADSGIPPFAFDPTAKGARYQWAQRQEGWIINYIGTPDRNDAPAWLLLIQEPQPGVPPDQLYEDEEHHKLIDGTMLHVSTWKHSSGAAAPERLITAPQIEGWQQLYAVEPSANPIRPGGTS
jgi:hypothetical protein